MINFHIIFNSFVYLLQTFTIWFGHTFHYFQLKKKLLILDSNEASQLRKAKIIIKIEI